MRIVIIEDEALTAADLKDSILKVATSSKIDAVLGSIQEAEEYFLGNPLPELLFCDIQLGDGSIFDLLNKVNIDVPIIFCTAYNEHALQAFKLNGIEYILKPFSKEDVLRALNKYERLRSSFKSRFDYNQLQLPKQQHLLVHYRDTIVPVPFSDIGMIFIANQVVYLQTFANKKYVLHKTLEELEQTLDRQFFRVNRTAIINKKLVQEVGKLLTRKLLIQLPPDFKTDLKLTVSKTKAPAFLKWMKGI
ncbi:LytR/AlgR family response regulator transcription factor [Fluviicola chungangensis]|uniref:Response regulator transcription factor n=1 Tax=Fluviicola chungangensis TaxID=2597671 RepID=A0A556N6S2_9FLAO|nr:LytTR family DNA-binding domain-containing protein [Fluviicola chungangensis]TSJ47811.1 response regulator transcription factor [Fluviicola chungangensis]